MPAWSAFRNAAARPWWGLALSLFLLPMLAPWVSPQAREPGRTVYKCVKGQSVTYTDEPCHAAVAVDVTPTRGLNRSSGVERKGPEVRRELQREQLADAQSRLLSLRKRFRDLAC